MAVIHTYDGELISVNCLECINTQFHAGEEFRHRFLNREFFFHRFSGFLRILVVLFCPGNELLKNAVLQFKAHCSVGIDLRSQAFHKIRVIVTRMELDKLHLLFLFVRKEGIIVKITVADNISGNFFCKIGLASTGRTSENQIFRFNQHRRVRIPISLELLDKLLLCSYFRFCHHSFFFVFFTVCQDKLISRFAKPLQTFLYENDRREDIPAVNNELTAIVITVGHIFYGIAVLLEIIDTCKNATNHIAVRVIFTNRKSLLLLNRQRCKLLFKNLASDAWHGLIGISSFTLAVRSLNNFPACLYETHIKRLIAITEA